MTTEHKTRYLLTGREYGLLELAPAMLDALRLIHNFAHGAQVGYGNDDPDTDVAIIARMARVIIDRIGVVTVEDDG